LGKAKLQQDFLEAVKKNRSFDNVRKPAPCQEKDLIYGTTSGERRRGQL